MNSIAETISNQLHPIFVSFGKRIIATNPTLIYDIGGTGNDAFLLRAYLSFRAHGDGDEIAVTVDVKVDNNVVMIVSDICRDNGQVVAVGPTASAPWKDDQSIPDETLTAWLGRFDRFLHSAESEVVKAVSALL